MAYYCVNKNAQANGDHEVHDTSSRLGCLPDASNRLALGSHASCASAVRQAKQHYSKANGCFYCASACHTQ